MDTHAISTGLAILALVITLGLLAWEISWLIHR